MARAYSIDLRERAMAALGEGATCRQVAARFAISVSAVVKWSQRLRQTGSVQPAPRSRPRPHKLAGEREAILGRLAAHPSVTTRQIAAELRARGVDASHMAVWRLLRAEGLSFKKEDGAR